jgi:hypothetical protein
MSLMSLNMAGHRQRTRQQDAALRERERLFELREFRGKQPRRTVTLADLEGRELPTVAAAAARVLELAGTLAIQDGRLVVERPERLSPNQQEHEQLEHELRNCVHVLIAAADIVVKAVESSSKKALAERLPTKQVGAAGGIA